MTITEFTDSIRQAATQTPLLPPPTLQPILPPVETGRPAGNVLEGVQVAELNPQTRAQYRLGLLLNYGVVVSDIADSSLARLNDMAPGDVIKSAKVGAAPWVEFKSRQDYLDFARTLKPDQSALLLISRSRRPGGLVILSPEK